MCMGMEKGMEITFFFSQTLDNFLLQQSDVSKYFRNSASTTSRTLRETVF